jgi:HEAT repeat protein
MKTYEELVAILSAIEPSEEMYTQITSEDIPLLERMLSGEEAWLSSRAVFALSRIRDRAAQQVLFNLTEDNRPEIRVSLASAAIMLPKEQAETILLKLMDDPEPGVRKFAIKSISFNPGIQLKDKIREVEVRENDTYLKELLRTKMNNIIR